MKIPRKPLFDEPLALVIGDLSWEEIDGYGLVLSAMNIPYAVVRGPEGWEIRVEESNQERAAHAIEQYRLENPDRPEPEAPPPRDWTAAAITTAAVILVLIGVHNRVYDSLSAGIIIREYGADAARILDGELYRTVTALFLHGDARHLLGNIAGIAVFAPAVCGVAGTVAGWLMILLAGALGNFANAIFFQTGHLSIGASTAVFGAVGILSAHQFLEKRKTPEMRRKAWLSLGGGLAFLGFMGAGEHTDITAHLFGLMAGAFIGGVRARYFRSHP